MTTRQALWIGFVWPEPESSAAGIRTIQLIQALQKSGWKIAFCSPAQPNEYRHRLEELGVLTEHIPSDDSRFDTYIRELSPDLVVFDRFMLEEQFSWRVRTQCPDAARILDTIDLHSLRRIRQRIVENSPESHELQNGLSINESDFTNEDALRELASIHRSDLTLMVSDFEMRLLNEHYGIPQTAIELCRFSVPDPKPGPPFEKRKHFVAIGNYRHAPNLDSYRILHRVLWPRIQQELASRGSSAELHIYGAYPTKELMDLDDPVTGFRVKGRAKNAQSTLSEYRINLAPLRFGAGIKGKITDGWAVGTPCVTTPIGAEGMHESLPFGGRIESQIESFARSAAELYLHSDEWQRSHQNGIEIIKKFYNDKITSEQFITRVDILLSHLERVRAQNYVGALLWHHQFRSTEYFSRWIESKNRD